MCEQVVRTASDGAMTNYFWKGAIPNEDFVMYRLDSEGEFGSSFTRLFPMTK